MAPARYVIASLVFLCVGALPAGAQQTDSDGRELYVESCLSCHGTEGAGTEFGPPIADAGEAAADFQLRTGRMPLADPDDQTTRKPPAFEPEQIDAIVEYVGSLGGGPPIPDVTPSAGDLVMGQELFVNNCAACHGATANGGAAGVGALAPSLYTANSLDIAEAVITGPGEMPRFDLDQEELNAITRYLGYIQEFDAPGGADIGGIGPVPEGFIGWTVGMLTLGLVCWFIGSRAKRETGSS
jgi:ubiquinol-cytochrome c reductase cytochrome c subunit